MARFQQSNSCWTVLLLVGIMAGTRWTLYYTFVQHIHTCILCLCYFHRFTSGCYWLTSMVSALRSQPSSDSATERCSDVWGQAFPFLLQQQDRSRGWLLCDTSWQVTCQVLQLTRERKGSVQRPVFGLERWSSRGCCTIDQVDRNRSWKMGFCWRESFRECEGTLWRCRSADGVDAGFFPGDGWCWRVHSVGGQLTMTHRRCRQRYHLFGPLHDLDKTRHDEDEEHQQSQSQDTCSQD